MGEADLSGAGDEALLVAEDAGEVGGAEGLLQRDDAVLFQVRVEELGHTRRFVFGAHASHER